jgi:Domain of unknown function (DUF4112)
MTTTAKPSPAMHATNSADHSQKVHATRVEVRPAGTQSQLQQDLAIARMVAHLMDAQFQIGPAKFGLDAVIGLIPGVGDLISAGVSMYPVFLAKKHGLGKRVIARMMLNIAADMGVGIIPILGDLTDVYFKANLKNLKLLEEALKDRK